MAIKIIKENDIYITSAEHRQYAEEYHRFCSFYCGLPPSFEDFVRQEKKKYNEKWSIYNYIESFIKQN